MPLLEVVIRLLEDLDSFHLQASVALAAAKVMVLLVNSLDQTIVFIPCVFFLSIFKLSYRT